MNQQDIVKVDAHTHLFYDRDFLVPLLERWMMSAVVINITGKRTFDEPMEQRWRAMLAIKEKHPEQFALCTSFDPEGIEEEGYADRVISRLREDIARGACMVKIWKDIGLELKDRNGAFIQVDDPRFRPIWDFLAAEDVPLLAHIAEPRAAWRPLDRKSPHFQYYNANPQYHLYLQSDVPSWESLIEGRDRWIEENPGLTIIGAHFGSTEHDLDLVAQRLDRYPNYYVDTAERFGDLVVQPSEKVRGFFIRYHDRILYGTDVIIDRRAADAGEAQQEAERFNYETLLQSHWNYLSSDQTIEVADKLLEPIRVPGLNLPSSVLRNVYAGNAKRLLRL